MTIRKTTDSIKKDFAAAGIYNPQREARFLVEGICRLSRGGMFLHSDMLLTDEEQEKIAQAAARRLEGYPLQYLIGEWDFYGYPFFVGEGVLIPRPETELLVREALAVLRGLGKADPAVADLCSGSGCIAVAVAKEFPTCRVTAVENSPEAFAYLEKNIERNKVSNVFAQNEDVLGPLADEMQGAFDVIVCNPPYIVTQELQTLQPEVQFEPRQALDGGEDGLLFYREITRLWQHCLAPGGSLLYEIGYDQGQTVPQLLRESGFSRVEVRQDYNGIDRIVHAVAD